MKNSSRIQVEIVVDDKGSVKLKQFGQNVDAASKSAGKSIETMNVGLTKSISLIGGMISAYAAVNIGKSLLDAGIAAETMGKSLEAALGSAQKATEAQKFLRQESERLGLVFMDQVKSYTSLAAAARGTALEGEQTQKIFTAVTTASTALGLSADQTSGALQAIQQMMSKGNVQAEELRGQLGERLPGAFNLAAEAMGKTTVQFNKMLDNGEVLATDLLPKLADALVNKYGTAATESANLTQANLNRMTTAFNDLKVAIIDDFMPAISSAVEGITNLIRLFPNLSKAIGLARTGLISFGDIATSNGTELNKLVNQFDPIVIKIAETKNKLDELKSGPMSWAYSGQIASVTAELEKLEAQQKAVASATNKTASEYEQMMAGRARREMDDIPLYVDMSSSRSTKGASAGVNAIQKAADEYADALKSVVDEYHQLTMASDAYAKLKIWEEYEKEAAVLGKNNEYLQAARDLKLQAIEDAKWMDNLQMSASSMQDYNMSPFDPDAAVKAAADRLALETDITGKINELTLSSHDYKVWLLDQEVQKMREAAGDQKDIIAQITAYQQLKLQEIANAENMWLQISKRTAEAMEEAFSDFFFDAMSGKISSFQDAWTAFMQTIYRITADYMGQIAKEMLFGKQIGDAGGSVGGLVGGLLGWMGVGSSAAGATTLSTGAVINPSGVAMFMHSGGIVGMDCSRMETVPMAMFANAPRLHSGLLPDEFPAILQRGEQVLSRQQVKDTRKYQPPQTIVNMTVHANDADSFNARIMQSKDIIAAAVMSARGNNHPSRRAR